VEPVDVLAERFPQLRVRDVVVIDDGWDSLVYEVNGEWIFRFPRRAEVERWLEVELTLLPELAGSLPVAVPRPELVARNGLLCVGYRKLPGEPATIVDDRIGADLAAFLRALHGFPAERARDLGVPSFEPAMWRARFADLSDDFRRRALPLLAADERTRAEVLFAEIDGLRFEPVLVHADLGPEHVLVRNGRVTGVIDWSDVRVGDPALDLAWPLHAAPAAVARAYPVDEEARRRALFYHRFAPWYEVTYGLDTGRDDVVARGLAGVRDRLP
jgi:aminoglycoside phosphotransferase (APT) family kinase protein